MPHTSIPNPATLWAWTTSSGATRTTLWNDLIPHLGTFMETHRAEIAQTLTGDEVTAVLTSEHRQSFLTTLGGSLEAWLVLTSNAGAIARALSTHAPWGLAKTGKKSWIGGRHDAVSVVQALLEGGDDEGATSFVKGLPFPLPSKAIRLRSMLSGKTPQFCRYALGCPRTGEGAALHDAPTVARLLHNNKHWTDDHFGMLLLAWVRGVAVEGRMLRTVTHHHDEPNRSYATWAQRSLSSLSLHQRMALLAQHPDPYTAHIDPAVWSALIPDTTSAS